MLAIIISLAIPLLAVLLWNQLDKEHSGTKAESVLRYLIYAAGMFFITAVLLAFTGDGETSFWVKINKSVEFALKYLIVCTGAVVLTAGTEWLLRKPAVQSRMDWAQWEQKSWMTIIRRYLAPIAVFVGAVLVVGLNASLMFDNVIWGDEAFSVNTAEKSMYGILQVLYYWDNHPPLHYYWIKLFGELFGFSIPVMHFACMIPFVVGIIWAVTLMRKYFGELSTLFFVVISGLGAACLEYNLEIRMYSLAFLGVAGCYYCAYRVIATDRKSAWVGMVLWALVGAYSHYYALASAGILIFCTGVAYWLKHRRYAWAKGLCAVLAYIVGYIPWMGFLFTATKNVSNFWWNTELLGLDKINTMIMGGQGMAGLLFPYLVLLLALLLLAESSIFVRTEQEGRSLLVMQRPGSAKWSDETYTMVVGAFTIIGTICFAYLLCIIVNPALAERYMYPVSAVAVIMPVIGSSRILKVLEQLGESLKMKALPLLGRMFIILLLVVLFVIGLGNYRTYSHATRQEDERTAVTLNIIGEPEEDVYFVSNGVQHLAWTVLYHYFPGYEVLSADFRMAMDQCDKFWYFSPYLLGEDAIGEMQAAGYTVTSYGELQLAKYPFALYYVAK